MSITVEIARSNGAGLTKVTRHRQNGETLLTLQQGAGETKLVLIVPTVATLYFGLPPSTRCESLYDGATLIEGAIAAPLGYLAKAIPEGPNLPLSNPLSTEISVAPGRMYIDLGNYLQIKRPLKVVAAIKRLEPGLLNFEISERPEASSSSDETRYTGVWSNKLLVSFPDNGQPLAAWLVCPHSGIDVQEAKTIGELRTKRSAN